MPPALSNKLQATVAAKAAKAAPATSIPPKVPVTDPRSRKDAVARDAQRRKWIAEHRAYLLDKALQALLAKNAGVAPEDVPPAEMLAILQVLAITDPAQTLDLNELLAAV